MKLDIDQSITYLTIYLRKLDIDQSILITRRKNCVFISIIKNASGNINRARRRGSD